MVRHNQCSSFRITTTTTQAGLDHLHFCRVLKIVLSCVSKRFGLNLLPSPYVPIYLQFLYRTPSTYRTQFVKLKHFQVFFNLRNHILGGLPNIHYIPTVRWTPLLNKKRKRLTFQKFGHEFSRWSRFDFVKTSQHQELILEQEQINGTCTCYHLTL